MDFISKITSYFLQKKEKNIIIDPISCLIKLSMLGLYPIGTKISVCNNGIHFTNPNILQGSIRFINGDAREDLHNVFKPIKKAIEWFYDNKNINDDINLLFDMTELGLVNLKNCYEPNSTIQHSIDYYIKYIKFTEFSDDKKDQEEDNIIYKYLRSLWSKREIDIIIKLFQEYKDKENDLEKFNIIEMINKMSDMKERLLNDFLRDQCSTL